MRMQRCTLVVLPKRARHAALLELRRRAARRLAARRMTIAPRGGPHLGRLSGLRAGAALRGARRARAAERRLRPPAARSGRASACGAKAHSLLPYYDTGADSAIQTHRRMGASIHQLHARRGTASQAALSLRRRRSAAKRRHVSKAEDAAETHRSLCGSMARCVRCARGGRCAAARAPHLRCGGAGVADAHHGARAAAVQPPGAHRRRQLRQRDAQRVGRRRSRDQSTASHSAAFASGRAHVDDQRRRGQCHHGGQLRRAHLSARRRGAFPRLVETATQRSADAARAGRA